MIVEVQTSDSKRDALPATIVGAQNADNAIVTDKILGLYYYNDAEKFSDDELDTWEQSKDVTLLMMLYAQSDIPFIEKRDYIGNLRFFFHPKFN